MRNTFFCIDGHTAGNPVRLVAGGAPLLRGNSMSERRQDFLNRFDWIRTGLCFEPRGHDMMSGGFLYPPTRPDTDLGEMSRFAIPASPEPVIARSADKLSSSGNNSRSSMHWVIAHPHARAIYLPQQWTLLPVSVRLGLPPWRAWPSRRQVEPDQGWQITANRLRGARCIGGRGATRRRLGAAGRADAAHACAAKRQGCVFRAADQD